MLRLKELRKARNETQADIAEVIGITRAAYANIENGRREPDFETLILLSDHFEVSVDYILGRENEKVPTPATAEDGLDRNIVRILGRDGSRYEAIVSDSQRELFKQMLDNLKPVDDENL